MKEMNVYNDEIDLIVLLSKLWNDKRFIICATIVGAIFGIVVAFSIPKSYESKIVFAPEIERQLGSGVSSIASMMGVSLDNSIDAISVDMFPDVIASTPFMFQLFDLQVSTVDTLNTTLLDYMKNHQKSPWWTKVIGAPFKLMSMILHGEVEEPEELELHNLPLMERVVIKNLYKSLMIQFDKKTGKTTIICRMQDPLVAATFLNAVVDNLKEYMSEYRTSKDRQNVENLEIICNERKADYYAAQKAYSEFVDANKNLVLLSAQVEQQKLQQEMNLAYQVYSQVATQLEAARIKVQQSKPVFVVLEPVSVPCKKAAPSKAKLLVIFAILGFSFACGWSVFGKDFLNKFKDHI